MARLNRLSSPRGSSNPRPQRRQYDPITDPLMARWAAQRQEELKDAARRMGIPLRLLRQWLKTHPELAAAMEAGRHVADAEVVQSLHDLAKGYEYPESQAELSRKIDGNQKLKNKKLTKRRHPDFRAIRLWLTNRMPDQWSTKPKPIEPNEIIARIRPVPQLPYQRPKSEPSS